MSNQSNRETERGVVSLKQAVRNAADEIDALLVRSPDYLWLPGIHAFSAVISKHLATVSLVEAERDELRRAIAESDITNGLLENADIDALVDLFESWLERRGKPMAMKCRLCGKGATEIRGYLKRMNETGVDGVWECRPSCDADLSAEERILSAIEDDIDEPAKRPISDDAQHRQAS